MNLLELIIYLMKSILVMLGSIILLHLNLARRETLQLDLLRVIPLSSRYYLSSRSLLLGFPLNESASGSGPFLDDITGQTLDISALI